MNMGKDDQDHDFVDRIYAVAMEPERFRELADIWQAQLDVNGDALGKQYAGNAELLEQHFRRADTILHLVSNDADSLPQPLQEKLNREPQAVIAISDKGKIEVLNGAAAILFNVEEGQTIEDLPFDEFGKKIAKGELRRLTTSSPKQTVSTPGLFRIASSENDLHFLVTFTMWETAGSRQFMLMKSTDFHWPDHLTPMIKSAFSLTNAEANIVKLIVEGHSVESISKCRDSSISTVRAQIRSLYDKTWTKNQSEFIRMAIGLTTLQAIGKQKVNGVFSLIHSTEKISYPLPEHRRLLSLPDGRILDYAVFGPKDGKPCIFFHHAYYGDIWPQQLARQAEKNGLQIILPARGYYGQTSPYPDGALNYEQTALDIEILRTRLKIDKAVLISQTTGYDFSLHYAHKYPEAVKALVGIAPSLPFSSVEEQEGMPKFSKFIATVAGRNPQMLKFIAKSGYAYHGRIGSKRFIETILAQCPADINIVKDPVNRDAIVRGFQYCTTHKHKAFYYDYLQLIPEKWEKTLNLPCPLHVVIGSDDRNSRKDRYEKLKAAGSNIKYFSAADGGEMLFFSHPDLVIDCITQAWA